MKVIKLMFLIVVFIIQASCFGRTQQGLPDDIGQQAQERIDNGYHLGTVIGIIDENGSQYYCFGQMSLTDSSKPDENSIFEIGSITKTFTSTLLADLDRKGEINIQDPVEKHLSIFKKVLRQGTETITLENLATHTSGLPREPLNMEPNNDHRYKEYSIDDLNDFLSNYSLESNPKTFLYSNVAVFVLEHAIELKMNTSYESLVKERIINVLNMNDTHFTVPADKRKRLVTGYRNGKHTDEVDVGQFPAMGGIRSTAKDMLRYLGAQLDIYPSSLSEVMKSTHQERFANDENVMGLGWEILKTEESGKTIHFHKGGTNGFVSFAGFNLEDQIGVIILVNGRRWFSDLGFRLLDPTYPLAKPE